MSIRKKYPKLVLTLIVTSISIAVLNHSSVTKAAACAAPTTDRGSVTSIINIPSDGTYRIWSRIMSGTTATDNSYSLDIDSANCYVVGDNDTMPTSAWTWVDYQNGTTTSKIDVSLSAGAHTFKAIGREDTVKLDRIIAVTDTTCTPTGTGGNCALPDTSAPIVSVTAPTNGATVSNTVSVTANASDDSGTVTKVEFYIDGVLASTDTDFPYSYSWDTAQTTNGLHSLVAKAYDGSNNVGTSSAVNVTTSNTTVCLQSTTTWQNNSISSQTGTFTFDYDATPSATGLDDVVGLSNGAADAYTGLAAIVRFNTTGTIDARNGGAYAAVNNVSYTNGTSYHFTLTVNPSVHTYSVTVTPSGGASTTIATNYAFRTEQASISSLSNWALFQDPNDSGGSMTVCNVTLNQNTTSKLGDLNNDGQVNIFDLSIMLTNYNSTNTTCDLNTDGTVNIFDLSILLSHYGI